jgi:anti-sigma regulatory factor (Ser/Thr protein kinase)
LNPKAPEFKNILVNRDIDAFCIVEADSSLAIENENKRTTPGYNIYTLPCSRRRASGMIIRVKQQLTAEFKIIKERANNNEGEVIEITVWKGRQKNNYIFIYNPPRNGQIFFRKPLHRS